MNKSQKTWLWVSIGIFLIPEIFFSFIPTFFEFMTNGDSFNSLAIKLFGSNFWEANSIIVSLFLLVEYIGLLSLFVVNIKFNNHTVYKWMTAIFLGFLLVILSVIVLLIYSITHISFP